MGFSLNEIQRDSEPEDPVFQREKQQFPLEKKIPSNTI
jgi:hypothetical protein